MTAPRPPEYPGQEPCPYCNGSGCLECRGRGTVGPHFRSNRDLAPYQPTPTVQTQAGRDLLDHFAPMPPPDAQELHRRSAMGRRVKLEAGIVTIETEARRMER